MHYSLENRVVLHIEAKAKVIYQKPPKFKPKTQFL